MTGMRLGGSYLALGVKTKESKCLNCKKRFWHTEEHVYRGCCSWSCLCRYREKQENKRMINGRKRVVVQTEAQALSRIAECERRIAHYDEVLKIGALSRKERNTKNGLLWQWRKKLDDAKAMLEEIRSEADEQGDY